MAADQRKKERVAFSKGFDANMMAIDGTWRRACILMDVSQSGARLGLQESIQGINLKEFFLLLSSSGLAYRRCELAWVNGDEIGVSFLSVCESCKKRRSKQADEVA
jgi:hypothetical protein